MQKGFNVLPAALQDHRLANWMRDSNNVKSITPIGANLFLLREHDCEFNLQEWATFSSVLCKGLAARHKDNPSSFAIYAYDELLVTALEKCVPNTEDKWMVILAQGPMYLETSLRGDYFRFTRFSLVHDMGLEGFFEFCAFIPKGFAPTAATHQMDTMLQTLKRMERDIVEMQRVVKKAKAGTSVSAGAAVEGRE